MSGTIRIRPEGLDADLEQILFQILERLRKRTETVSPDALQRIPALCLSCRARRPFRLKRRAVRSLALRRRLL